MAKFEPQNSLIDVLLDEVVGGDMPPDVSLEVVDKINSLEGSGVSSATPEKSKKTNLRDFIPLGIGLALVVIIAVATPLLLRQDTTSGQAEGSESKSEMPQIPLERPLAWGSNSPMPLNEPLEASELSSIRFSYTDGSQVEIMPSGSARLIANEEEPLKKAIFQEKGGIRVNISDQLNRQPFTLRNEFVQLTMSGAQALSFKNEKFARVRALSGSLRVESLLEEEGLDITSDQYVQVFADGTLVSGEFPQEMEFVVIGNEKSAEIRRIEGDRYVTDVNLKRVKRSNLGIRFDLESLDKIRYVRFVIERKDPRGRVSRYLSFDDEAPFHVFGEYMEGEDQKRGPWNISTGEYTIFASVLFENGVSLRKLAELAITVTNS